MSECASARASLPPQPIHPPEELAPVGAGRCPRFPPSLGIVDAPAPGATSRLAFFIWPPLAGVLIWRLAAAIFLSALQAY